jgi:hypothetical protein
MADKELLSPLGRAKYGVLPWIDLLDKDARLEACMALDRLCQVAEREIDQAYRDGASNRSEAVRASREAKPPPVAQS